MNIIDQTIYVFDKKYYNIYISKNHSIIRSENFTVYNNIEGNYNIIKDITADYYDENNKESIQSTDIKMTSYYDIIPLPPNSTRLSMNTTSHLDVDTGYVKNSISTGNMMLNETSPNLFGSNPDNTKTTINFNIGIVSQGEEDFNKSEDYTTESLNFNSSIDNPITNYSYILKNSNTYNLSLTNITTINKNENIISPQSKCDNESCTFGIKARFANQLDISLFDHKLVIDQFPLILSKYSKLKIYDNIQTLADQLINFTQKVLEYIDNLLNSIKNDLNNNLSNIIQSDLIQPYDNIIEKILNNSDSIKNIEKFFPYFFNICTVTLSNAVNEYKYLNSKFQDLMNQMVNQIINQINSSIINNNINQTQFNILINTSMTQFNSFLDSAKFILNDTYNQYQNISFNIIATISDYTQNNMGNVSSETKKYIMDYFINKLNKEFDPFHQRNQIYYQRFNILIHSSHSKNVIYLLNIFTVFSSNINNSTTSKKDVQNFDNSNYTNKFYEIHPVIKISQKNDIINNSQYMVIAFNQSLLSIGNSSNQIFQNIQDNFSKEYFISDQNVINNNSNKNIQNFTLNIEDQYQNLIYNDLNTFTSNACNYHQIEDLTDFDYINAKVKETPTMIIDAQNKLKNATDQFNELTDFFAISDLPGLDEIDVSFDFTQVAV